MKLLLITGLSGAGKSTALRTMEDLGYETMDNVPMSLIPLLLSSAQADDRMIVVGADVRGRDFSVDEFTRVVNETRASQLHEVSVLFLDCQNEMLLKRYSETRRRHPLAKAVPVLTGIQRERRLLMPLQDAADEVIDTTDMQHGELRELLKAQFAARRSQHLAISIESFSFKRGVPREADLVFDVRFLRNPFYVETLRPLTGRDKPVGEYIEGDDGFAPFLSHLTDLLLPLLPRYQRGGKSYLTIAIGCTGGKHRSVYVATRLAEALAGHGYDIASRHRDIPQPAKEPA